MRRLTGALCLLAVLPAPASAAVPVIHAHRGAHTAYGRPEFGEETLRGFHSAFGAWGAVVEADAKLTRDGVPVALHDATLDRTTTCSGRVADRTLAELAGCRVDTIGSPGGPLGSAAAGCSDAIPTIAEVLADARGSGAAVNLEIKNYPTEPDYAAGAADKVMDVVLATGMPKERLIIQSFTPENLEVAKTRLPGVPTSLLTLQAANTGGPATAAGKYDWVSPEWPVDAAYVTSAHTLGLKIVPYTLDTAGQVQAAAALGVDALITDDAGMARRALGLPDGSDPGGLVCIGPPPPAAPGGLAPPATQISVPGLASDAFTSPRMQLRWRGRGDDDGRATSFLADVRPVASHREADWRALVVDAPQRATVFTGTPGATFVLRVSARDGSGRLGPAAARAITVPFDDASRLVRRSGPWKRARSRGAWRRRVSTSATRRAKLTLPFKGRRVRVVARRSARAGRLAVTLDGRRRVVATAGTTAARAVVFDSGRLRAGRHRVVLRPAGGGRVEIDAIAPG